MTWQCIACGAQYDAPTNCPVCGSTSYVEADAPPGKLTVSGDVRAEVAIQALSLAVEAMRAQIQAQAVRITILEEKLDP